MTVASAINKAQYQHTGPLPVTYTFPLKVYSVSEVLVVASQGGVDTTLHSGLYSVSLNANQNDNPGGSVTITGLGGLAPTRITILRGLPATQSLSLPQGSAVHLPSLEAAFDRVTILVQQMQEALARAVKVGQASSMTPEQLLQQLSQNSTAVLAAAQDVAEDAQAAAASAALAQTAAQGVDFTTTSTTTLRNKTLDDSCSVAQATLATRATHLAGGSAGSVPCQSAAGVTQMTPPGVAGQVLVCGGSAPPEWVSALPNGTTATVQGLGDISNAVATHAGINNSMLGGTVQSYQNVTASRALGTTYTNSTHRPILVLFGYYSDSGLNGACHATVSGTVVQEGYGKSGSTAQQLSFIVPPGATYSISAAGIGRWVELR